jgi:hypothetical protein
MRLPRIAVLCSLGFVAGASSLVAQDELPPQTKAGKVCVAIVGDTSTTPAPVERLTERLTKSLKQNKINAVTMDSRTTDKHPLELSIENGEEAKAKECDYILLSQIRDPRQHPLEPQVPEISIGGRVPSIDASDPLGGSSGPVYRENLHVDFALFQVGRLKPVLDTYVLEKASANVSDSFLPAMDQEANRVGHELKKH